MKTIYKTTNNLDGSVTVESRGPISRASPSSFSWAPSFSSSMQNGARQ